MERWKEEKGGFGLNETLYCLSLDTLSSRQSNRGIIEGLL